MHLPEIMRPPPSQLPTRLMKFLEESEEIRLLLTQFLYQQCVKMIVITYMNIQMILQIFIEFFQWIFLGKSKNEGCKSLTKFCKVNHQMLLHFTEKMGRAILHPLLHQKHYLLFLCGVWKNNAFVFEILTGFKDPNSVPIKAFYEPMHHINYFVKQNFINNKATLIIDPKQQEIGFWLRGLADRWDHHPRLYPYLLSGLFDSYPSIQEAALQIIEDVGKEWEVEKEKDIKNVKQLGIEPAWTFDGKLSQLPFVINYT